MRNLFLVLILIISATTALACGRCGGSSCSGCGPDWAYTYTNPEFIPDCVPCAVSMFQSALIPMVEARKSRESAYIREKAECLYWISREIPKSDPCCCRMDHKRFVRASKDLVKSCNRLKDLAYGGTSSAVYAQMRQVEEEFIRVVNLCD